MPNDRRNPRSPLSRVSTMLADLRTLVGRPKPGGGTELGTVGNLIREEDGYKGMRYIVGDDGTTVTYDNIPNEAQVAALTAAASQRGLGAPLTDLFPPSSGDYTTQLQQGINNMISAGNPVTTQRGGVAAGVLSPSLAPVTKPLVITGVRGFNLRGTGLETSGLSTSGEYRTTANQLREAALVMNGASYTTLEGFRVVGQGKMTYGLVIDWFSAGQAASATGNALGYTTAVSSAVNAIRDFSIDASFRFGIGVGPNSGNLDISDTIYERINIHGHRVPSSVTAERARMAAGGSPTPDPYYGATGPDGIETGDATGPFWEAGAIIGSGSPGNILNHNWKAFSATFVKYGTVIDTVNSTSFNVLNGAYQEALLYIKGTNYQSTRVTNGRAENMVRLILTATSKNPRHLSVNNYVYDPNTEAANDSGNHYIAIIRAPGGLTFSNLVALQTRNGGRQQQVQVDLPTAQMTNGGHLSVDIHQATMPTYPLNKLVSPVGTSQAVLNVSGYHYGDDSGVISHVPNPVTIGYNTPSLYQLGDNTTATAYTGESDSIFEAVGTGGPAGAQRRGFRVKRNQLQQFYLGPIGTSDNIYMMGKNDMQFAYWLQGASAAASFFIMATGLLVQGPLIVGPRAAPATANAAGQQGTIIYDANYMYVCVADNTWKRTPLSTW